MGKRTILFCDVCGGNIDPGTGAHVKVTPYAASANGRRGGDVCDHCLGEKELVKLPAVVTVVRRKAK